MCFVWRSSILSSSIAFSEISRRWVVRFVSDRMCFDPGAVSSFFTARSACLRFGFCCGQVKSGGICHWDRSIATIPSASSLSSFFHSFASCSVSGVARSMKMLLWVFIISGYIFGDTSIPLPYIFNRRSELEGTVASLFQELNLNSRSFCSIWKYDWHSSSGNKCTRPIQSVSLIWSACLFMGSFEQGLPNLPWWPQSISQDRQPTGYIRT